MNELEWSLFGALPATTSKLLCQSCEWQINIRCPDALHDYPV
ncbi:hypothetical protein NYE69_10885 [Paenibacillus sp. FSL R5-0527]